MYNKPSCTEENGRKLATSPRFIRKFKFVLKPKAYVRGLAIFSLFFNELHTGTINRHEYFSEKNNTKYFLE